MQIDNNKTNLYRYPAAQSGVFQYLRVFFFLVDTACIFVICHVDIFTIPSQVKEN